MDISFGNYQNVKNAQTKTLPVATFPGKKKNNNCTGAANAGGSISRIIDRLLGFIDALLDVISASRVISVIRAVLCVLCFIAIIGIIGGIEQGTIGFMGGAIAALVVTAFEFLLIHKRK